MAASFEDLQRVLFVGEPHPFGPLHAKQDHVTRRAVPCRAMRSLPVEIVSDRPMAPFGFVLFVQRWPAIVAGGNAVGSTLWLGCRGGWYRPPTCQSAPGECD